MVNTTWLPPGPATAVLQKAWAANRPGSTTAHAVVVVPSYSLSPTALAYFAGKLHAYEHRYLVTALMLGRVPGCEWVFVSSQDPEPAVLDYYVSLLPEDVRESARRRMHVVTVADPSARPLATKLLEHPEAFDEIRAAVGSRPALLEPWNVSAVEAEMAEHLGVPINGTAPGLAPIAHKSAGRRLLAEAGVPVPHGREGVRSFDDVLGAVTWIQEQRPSATAVVLKHDDGVSGVGNAVLRVRNSDGTRVTEADFLRSWAALPADYRTALREGGGVVEELLTGDDLSSPSVQADITPPGDVVVLSTHEQLLGGDTGQVYEGCAFPALADYAPTLAQYGEAVGSVLARHGALGRFSVDFVAARGPTGWLLHGIEINLRRGGTTHPFAVLRHLVPGSYDTGSGSWVGADGATRAYRCTDHLMDPSWSQLTASRVIDAVADAGLHFDHRSQRGVVLHMMCALEIEGRLGVTAIAPTDAEAAALVEDTRAAIGRCV